MFILLLFLPLILASGLEPENYFSIGAHLNADSLSKLLKKTVFEDLAKQKIENVLASQPKTLHTVNETTFHSHLNDLDGLVQNVFSSLATSYSPLNSSLLFECNDIHQVFRVPMDKPCYVDGFVKKRTEAKLEFKPSISPSLSTQFNQFLYSDGFQFEFPAQFLSTVTTLHWRSILSMKIQKKANVLLLFDTAHISSESHLDTFKRVGLHLVDILPFEMNVLVLSSDGKTASCGFKEEKDRRSENKRFVEELSLSQNSSGEHAESLRKAVLILPREKDANNVIIYISRGVLSELGEAGEVMKIMAETFVKQKKNIPTIHTIMLTEELRPPMSWSSQFLHSLANMDFNRHNGTIEEKTLKELEEIKVKKGKAITLNKPVNEILTIERMTELFVSEDNEMKQIATRRAIIDDEKLILLWESANKTVVTGTETPLSFLSYYLVNSQILMMTRIRPTLMILEQTGSVLWSSDGVSSFSLSKIDNWKKSDEWLLKEFNKEGIKRGDMEIINNKGKKKFYVWRKILDTPLIVLLRTSVPFESYSLLLLESQNKQLFPMDSVIWHNDAPEHANFCTHFGNSVDFGHGALFINKNKIGAQPNQWPTTRNAWVFVTDTVGLIRSSNIRQGIREDVGVLSNLVKTWKLIKRDTPVVRRYAASRNGVFMVYPATSVEETFDPLRQKWYTEAVANPGHLIIGEPRVDPHYGDLVTISTTFNIEQGNRSNIFGVLSMDVTTAYLGEIVHGSINTCSNGKRCILFNSDGYVSYSDQELQGRAPSEAIERFHLSHLEPLLASHMTSNNRLVTKRRCLTKEGIRRDYKWNKEFTRVHTTPCDDSNPRYGGSVHSEVIRVPGSTIFLAIVNSSCVRTPVTMFCPCSVHDRRCLFCGRFDSSECECPCQCSHEICNNDDSVEVCESSGRSDRMMQPAPVLPKEKCEQASCPAFLTASTCRSQLGCEWCIFKENGDLSAISSCSSLNICYQGVAGRRIDKSSEIFLLDKWSSSVPFGPVGAAIVVVTVIFAAIAFCYKSQMPRLVSSRTSSDTPLFDNGSNSYDCDIEHSILKEEKLVQLASFEVAAPEPRRVMAGSDHGYSTMTDRNTAEETESSISTTLTDRCGRLDPIAERPVSVRMTPSMVTSIITTAEVYPEPQRRIQHIIS